MHYFSLLCSQLTVTTQLRMELKDMKIKTFKEFLEDKTNPVVYCLLSSNGKDFLAKESYKVELHQYNCQHDTFTIETPEDSFDAFNEYIMEHSRDLLGEPLTIKLYQYGKVVQHFSGIITRIYCKRQTGGGYGTLYISGNAPSILLDQGKTCNSYENKTLKEIITLVSEGYDNSAQVDSSAGVNTTRALPYTVQYNESDYDFICRLANLYGEYFYYDGSKLIFGNKLQETIDLGENLNLIDEDFNLEMKPQDFEYINYAIDRAEVYRKDAESACCEYKNNPIQTDAKNASKKLFKKIPQKYHSATSLEQSDIDLEEVVRQERDLRELSLKVTGRSRDPRLRMSTFACLTDINARAMETYRVIKISHYHSGMNYENSFEGIPLMRTPADYNAEAFPKAEQQPAIVKDNNDPQGMGRVRVQFFWQKGEQLSPWIRMIQPYAGSGKGFYFIPEVGEEVMVDFENGNAERPFVLGAHYNGAAKSGYNPTTKAIHTQSGTKILLNDAEGSVRIEDASRNIYEMDGQGNINLYAPNNIRMSAGKNFDLNVGNNLNFTIGGQATMNILQKMFLNTPFMQQIISDYLHTQTGRTLLIANNEIKIEGKETNVAGMDRLFMHSDSLTTINSKGELYMKGLSGTTHSNKADNNEKTPLPYSKTNVVVHFRPKDDWRGEYGFDWIRKANRNVHYKEGGYREQNYQKLIGKYYTLTDKEIKKYLKNNNDITSLNFFFIKDANTWFVKDSKRIIENFHNDPQYKEEDNSYNSLLDTFECFRYRRNRRKEEIYYKSYISLFPKEENYGIYEAEVDLHIHFFNREKVDYLFFKIAGSEKSNLIHLNKDRISNPQKRETIKISCEKIFPSDINIEVYAVQKQETNTENKEGEENIYLAGCITVVAPIIRTINIVPVRVKTITPDFGDNNDINFDFFKKILRQALVKVNIIQGNYNLDLSQCINSNGNFIPEKEKNYNFKFSKGDLIDSSGIDDFVEEEFKISYPGLDNYHKIYFFDIQFRKSSTNIIHGYAKKGDKHTMIFNAHPIITVVHETLHALGLLHSFCCAEKGTYTFKAMETFNIMDYSHLPYDPKKIAEYNKLSNDDKKNIDIDTCKRNPKNSFNLWLWQWKKISNFLAK